jgi:hypothetical protein
MDLLITSTARRLVTDFASADAGVAAGFAFVALFAAIARCLAGDRCLADGEGHRNLIVCLPERNDRAKQRQ